MWPHHDSSKSFTKGRKNGIKMGHQEKSKSRISRFTNCETKDRSSQRTFDNHNFLTKISCSLLSPFSFQNFTTLSACPRSQLLQSVHRFSPNLEETLRHSATTQSHYFNFARSVTAALQTRDHKAVR